MLLEGGSTVALRAVVVGGGLLAVQLSGAPAEAGRRWHGLPVADAGPDQDVADADGDGVEAVTLDGSASFDPNGLLVTWSWHEDATALGTGEILTTSLPVGPHAVTLTVQDDASNVASDTVTVTVEAAAPCQADCVEPLTLYHIGHSLTDRMVDLLSFTVETWTGLPVLYASKSIPGASLYWHWAEAPTEGRKGNIQTGNALEVLHSGQFDALVLTESAALDYYVGNPEFGSEQHANLWVDEYLTTTNLPDPRVFVYSTWAGRNVDGPDTPDTIETFLSETERLQGLWEVIAQSIRDAHPGLPVHVVPGGLVLKRLQEQVLDGTLTLPGGLTFRQTFFKENRPGFLGGCGTPDPIHLSQTGIYAIALTHYAVLYGSCPIGLPTTVAYPNYDDGCLTAESVTVDPELARHVQAVVWDVVNGYAWSGMP